MNYKNLLLTIFGLISLALPAQAGPQFITYEGYIEDTSTTPATPYNGSHNFKFKVLGPTGTCEVYGENSVAVNVVQGHFVIKVGLSINQSYVAAPATNFSSAINATVLLTGQDASLAPCNVNPGDPRRLQVFLVGDTNPVATIDLSASAYSIASENSTMLDGKTSTDFIQTTTDTTQARVNALMAPAVYDNLLNLSSANTGAFELPSGTNAQRPAGSLGMIRFNDDSNKVEFHDGATWVELNSGASSGVNSLASTNSYLTIGGTASDPTVTANVGTAANTLAAGNDSRIVNAIQNEGFTPSIKAVGNVGFGAETATGSGRLVVVTDTSRIYRDGGAGTWNMLTSLNFNDLSNKPTIDTLVPSQAGNNGKVLTTDGTSVSWQIPASAPVTSVAGRTGAVTLAVGDLALPSGNIIVGNASNVATGVTVSGDVTLSNTGVVSLGTNKVTSSHIVDGTVSMSDLADGSVTDAKINSVGVAKLVGVIDTSNLGTGTANSTTFLRGDGQWMTPSAAAGGANKQVQINNGGALAGDSNFVWDTGRLGVGTSTPSVRLDVNESIAYASGADLRPVSKVTLYYSNQPESIGDSGFVIGSSVNLINNYTLPTASYNGDGSGTNPTHEGTKAAAFNAISSARVPTGTINEWGGQVAVNGEAWRDGSAADDSGRLGFLAGGRFVVGHNAATSRITDEMVGVTVEGKVDNGTVGKYIGLSIRPSKVSGGGTVTKDYGVVQEGSNSLNVFEGPLKLTRESAQIQVSLKGPASADGAPTVNYNLVLPSDTPAVGDYLKISSVGADTFTEWAPAGGGGAASSVLANPGSMGSPSISFSSDNDTGFYSTNPGTISASSNGFERFTIHNSGNIGIGTGAPSSLLDVQGDSGGPGMINSSLRNFSSTGTTFFRAQNDTSGMLFLGMTGNAFSGGGGLYPANSASIYSNPNVSSFNIGTEGAQPFKFFTNNTERLRIGENGNIGLGMTSAATGGPLLDVGIGGFRLADDNVTTCTALNEGVVRRNVTAGGLQLCKSLQWISFGGIGQTLATTPFTTSYGVGAAASVSTGTYNTSLGFSSGSGLTIGSQNTAVGAFSLSAAVTTTQTTAVGYEALRFSSGNYNTAFGWQAMQDSAGTSNVAIGHGSMSGAGGTGSNNIALGSGALNANSMSGSQNIAIGSSAGSNLTTGTGNILIGHNILSPSISSNYFLGIGNLIFGDMTNNRLGIGTGNTTTLTKNLSLSGNSLQSIGMERRNDASSVGQGLTINAGGAKVAQADQAGGNLILASGISTGTGSSNIQFQTSTPGSSSSTDNTVSTKMTILGNGRVGIGTANPTTQFSILGSSGFVALQSIIGSGSDPAYQTIRNDVSTTYFGSNDAAGSFVTDGLPYASFFGNSSSNSLQLVTGASARVTLTSGGNVGIGTNTPSKKLDVIGDISSSTGIYTTNLYSSSGNLNIIPMGSGSQLRLGNMGNIGGPTVMTTPIAYQSNGGSWTNSAGGSCGGGTNYCLGTVSGHRVSLISTSQPSGGNSLYCINAGSLPPIDGQILKVVFTNAAAASVQLVFSGATCPAGYYTLIHPSNTSLTVTSIAYVEFIYISTLGGWLATNVEL